MDRKQIEECIRSMYAARVANDAAACTKHFTPDAKLSLVGEDERAYQSGDAIPGDVGEQIEALVATWNWLQISNQRIVIDGNMAAVYYQLKTVFTPTGDEIDTQLSDHIVMSDCGRIAEFTEFVDTALIQGLASKVQ